MILAEQEITFKKVWNISEKEDRFISIVYSYAPKYFSWLEYLTISVSIGVIAQRANSKTFEYLGIVTEAIFVLYTLILILTVARHYTQKIRGGNERSKMVKVASFIFAVLCSYGSFVLINNIKSVLDLLISKSILN